MDDFPKIRWLQLAAGVLGMVAVTNLQYAWTFFVSPLQERFGWSKAEIQIAFSIFVAAETWLVPIEAWLADRFGTRKLVFVGGILVGLSWYINAHAVELWHIYAGNAIGGAGAGIVYGISIGSALRWFPDRRGLAAGITSAAFGAGSALTVVPIYRTIHTYGYQTAFLWFGLAQGLVVLLTALVLRPPRPGELPQVVNAGVTQSTRDYHPLEMLRTRAFWTMYVLMTMVTVGGMMATAQLDPMARSLGVADVPFTILGWTVAAVALAGMIDRVLNGLTRPFFGWISDRAGRENTMFFAFLLEGLAILVWIQTAHIPIMFVIFSGLVYFAWGEIYSLFPALCGDMFGRRYATTNYAFLYTAKGTATLLVPLGSVIYAQTGSWTPVFALAIAFDWIVALAALFVLKPMLRQWHAAEEQAEATPAPAE
ncbi:MAG: oxalate/formate MFS antiporter [Gemmataceae bacterium]